MRMGFGFLIIGGIFSETGPKDIRIKVNYK